MTDINRFTVSFSFFNGAPYLNGLQWGGKCRARRLLPAKPARNLDDLSGRLP